MRLEKRLRWRFGFLRVAVAQVRQIILKYGLAGVPDEEASSDEA